MVAGTIRLQLSAVQTIERFYLERQRPSETKRDRHRYRHCQQCAVNKQRLCSSQRISLCRNSHRKPTALARSPSDSELRSGDTEQLAGSGGSSPNFAFASFSASDGSFHRSLTTVG
jgi:hypothetical protein